MKGGARPGAGQPKGSKETKRLYDSVRWRRARASYLREHPLCALCARQGRDVPASVVDHVHPHGGDYDLFWDRDNWQALCATCHGVKRRADHGKIMPGCDINGLPLDGRHHWNQGKEKKNGRV